MKFKTSYYLNVLCLYLLFLLTGCDNASRSEAENAKEGSEEAHGEIKEAMLSQQQFQALTMEVDTLKKRNFGGYVMANGKLEVPPQNEASVTTVLGANIEEILVIEGEQVRKGEVLAFISHPDIVELQSELIMASNDLEFLEKEYQRKKTLYEAGVGSGKEFEESRSDLRSTRGLVQGLMAQVQLLHLNPDAVLKGKIFQRVPVISPISGAVEEINVKTGQYVEARSSMFGIINNEDVHADLLVFEEDVPKVEVGQQVLLSVGENTEIEATVLSVSRKFETELKAVQVHAEIKDPQKDLIPGMYVRGRIKTTDSSATAFPQQAIAKEGNTSYVFRAEREGEAWSFRPMEVITGSQSGEWVEVRFLSPVEPGTAFAYNNAYYLMAEMNKGEGGHHH